MPVRFRILRELCLVYVRFDDHVTTDETVTAMRACAAHPDFNPADRTFIDFSRTTSYDRDWAGFMRMQAAAASMLYSPAHVPMLVYWAPTPLGQGMAQLALRSWEGVTAINGRILTERDQVLVVLGLDGALLDSLLEPAPS